MKCATRAHIHTFYIFIQLGYFYSASSSQLLPRGAPDADTVSEVHADAPHATASEGLDTKVLTLRLKRDSNPRPFGRKATNIPMSHQARKNIRTYVVLFHLRICLVIHNNLHLFGGTISDHWTDGRHNLFIDFFCVSLCCSFV